MRGFGWFFGILGGIALLGFGAAAWLFQDAEMPLVAKLAGGLSPVLFGIWLYLDWALIRRMGADQTTGRSLNAILASGLGLAIAVTANVATHDSTWRWDITKNKQYTLSQQSIDLVAKLDREVQVQAFFVKGAPDEKNFRDLLSQYQANTSLMKVEFHDPMEEPLLAQKLNITTENGTIVMTVNEKEQRIESGFDESAITNALIKVTSDKQHTVCMISGHGELDSEDTQTTGGFGLAKQKLENQNYRVSTITLTAGAPTREQCEVVVLAGPQSELLSDELDRIAQYVAGGGSLVALLDPSVPLPVTNDFSRYGLRAGDDVIIEPDPYRMFQNNPFGLIIDQSSYTQHPLTAKLKGNSILYLARSINKGDDVAGLDVKILASASESSWGESDYKDETAEPAPTPGRDIVGKVPVIAVMEVQDPSAIRTHTAATIPAAPGLPGMTAAPETISTPAPPPKAGGKVVAFGDADFASNQFIVGGLNQDLLLNTVAWMVGEEDQLSIRANEAAKGLLEMGTMDQLLLWLMALVVVPGALIMGAVGTWAYRRRL